MKCSCDGNGWTRMSNTKAIIYCSCNLSKFNKIVKSGTKVVTPLGQGEVIKDSTSNKLKIKFPKTNKLMDFDKACVSFIYDF